MISRASSEDGPLLAYNFITTATQSKPPSQGIIIATVYTEHYESAGAAGGASSRLACLGSGRAAPSSSARGTRCCRGGGTNPKTPTREDPSASWSFTAAR